MESTDAPLLYPYQRRWLADKSPASRSGMFSRQSGKSFTSHAGDRARTAWKPRRAGNRVRWVILSRGERQAKEAMEEGLNLHLRALKTVL